MVDVDAMEVDCFKTLHSVLMRPSVANNMTGDTAFISKESPHFRGFLLEGFRCKFNVLLTVLCGKKRDLR